MRSPVHPVEPALGSAGFRQESEAIRCQGDVISLSQGTFVSPDGERFDRDIVRHPGAVSVVPLLDDGRVVMVRQYRAAIDAELLEIPAGKRDVPGEPPELTAQRELSEEVGLRARDLKMLAEFHNSPGFSDEHSYVFLGVDLEPTGIDLHGVEEQYMQVVQVPLADALTMITDGSITDAKTIIGLLLTKRHLDT